jgi:hypothetical protein
MPPESNAMTKQTKAGSKGRSIPAQGAVPVDGATGNRGGAVGLASIHLNDGTHGLPKNPRFIKDERFKALVASVRDNPEFMPARPIIVDESGVILGGNMRYRACRELGMIDVPAAWVVQVTGWTVEKKRRFIILDNRGFGEDDMDMLANEWDIAELIAAGFTDSELGAFTADEADAPELKDGDRAPFRQATFTLHDEQWEEVESAIAKAKADGGGESAVNENSNGNALAWICGRFNRG